MTPSDLTHDLAYMAAQHASPVCVMRYLAGKILRAELNNGCHLRHACDFKAWLYEIAAELEKMEVEA